MEFSIIELILVPNFDCSSQIFFGPDLHKKGIFGFKTEKVNITTPDLKNCVHTRDHIRPVYAKAFELTRKNVHAKFEILLISKIPERYCAEMFYYYFIETSFVFHCSFAETQRRYMCLLFRHARVLMLY